MGYFGEKGSLPLKAPSPQKMRNIPRKRGALNLGGPQKRANTVYCAGIGTSQVFGCYFHISYMFFLLFLVEIGVQELVPPVTSTLPLFKNQQLLTSICPLRRQTTQLSSKFWDGILQTQLDFFFFWVDTVFVVYLVIQLLSFCHD
eukprot:TRINITY_DN29680_c0_g1_i2.p2 TRINITY_DN29680_c0_g1~~TRINITY_DN29680_c0_g1_i2.p2  ORF type:complete len:145 (+),score=12.10 TRINITY_DN29680_c0_g1_i2:630-1064(+)